MIIQLLIQSPCGAKNCLEWQDVTTPLSLFGALSSKILHNNRSGLEKVSVHIICFRCFWSYLGFCLCPDLSLGDREPNICTGREYLIFFSLRALYINVCQISALTSSRYYHTGSPGQNGLLVCNGYANSECFGSGLSNTNAHSGIYTQTHKGPLILPLINSIRIYVLRFVPSHRFWPVLHWRQTIGKNGGRGRGGNRLIGLG